MLNRFEIIAGEIQTMKACSKMGDENEFVLAAYSPRNPSFRSKLEAQVLVLVKPRLKEAEQDEAEYADESAMYLFAFEYRDVMDALHIDRGGAKSLQSRRLETVQSMPPIDMYTVLQSTQALLLDMPEDYPGDEDDFRLDERLIGDIINAPMGCITEFGITYEIDRCVVDLDGYPNDKLNSQLLLKTDAVFGEHGGLCVSSSFSLTTQTITQGKSTAKELQSHDIDATWLGNVDTDGSVEAMLHVERRQNDEHHSLANEAAPLSLKVLYASLWGIFKIEPKRRNEAMDEWPVCVPIRVGDDDEMEEDDADDAPPNDEAMPDNIDDELLVARVLALRRYLPKNCGTEESLTDM